MNVLLTFVVVMSAIEGVSATYSFTNQDLAKSPPDLTYPYSTPLQPGNAYETLVGVSGNGGFEDGAASSPDTTITAPQFVWADANGVVYFTDAANHIVRALLANNTVITFAGAKGVPGFNGNGAAAAGTQFNRPRGISGDANRIIICDPGNARIRAISLTAPHIVTTIAGTGSRGYSPDGTSATQAEVWSPHSVWVNALTEDVFFTEHRKCTIRMISGSTGLLTTIAGVFGVCGTNGDGFATSSLLNLPRAIFGDALSGTIFWTEIGSNLARKTVVGSNNVITLAGLAAMNDTRLATAVNAGDGALAKDAVLHHPSGIWVDRFGNVYIVESYPAVVRQIDAASKNISTVLGVQGARGAFTKNAGKNVLYHPRGIWGDEQTTFKLYLPDTDNHRIVTVNLVRPTSTPSADPTIEPSAEPSVAPTQQPTQTPSVAPTQQPTQTPSAAPTQQPTQTPSAAPSQQPTTVISTVAGGGSNAFTNGAVAIAVSLGPIGVCSDAAGNIYASVGNSNIYQVNTLGYITKLAGTGSSGVAGPEGTAATSTPFGQAYGLFCDSTGVIVADIGNSRIRRISWDTTPILNPVTTLVGGGNAFFDTGSTFSSSNPVTISATTFLLSQPYDVWGHGGDYFFGDSNRGVVLKLSGGSVSIIGGSYGGLFSFSGISGSANGAFLYVAKSSSIVKIDTSNGQATTIAGTSSNGNTADGVVASTSTPLNGPNFIWVDNSENIYFCEYNGNKIRAIQHSTGKLTTIAGTGGTGFSGDGGDPTFAKIWAPKKLWGDSNNNLYFVDFVNSRVRKITNLVALNRRLEAVEEGNRTMISTQPIPQYNYLRRA